MKVDPSSIEGIMLFVGIFGIIVAWVPRIYLFTRDIEDRVLNELLEDRSVFAFGDLLAYRIARSWNQLSVQSKRQSVVFVWVYLSSAALFITGFLLAYIRHWL